VKTSYVTATALALAFNSVCLAQERAPATDSISRDVILQIRPPPAAISGYRTSAGFICGFLKGHDQLRVTLKARRNCYGDLLNSVVFHGDGQAGPYSELADTKRELSRSQKAGHLVTVTYEPEHPDQPEGCWCDNRVIEWSSAPPPVREQGPETAAVSADVSVDVGSAARAAAAQPQAGAPPPAEVAVGEAVTEMHPGPQTAFGLICRVKWNREKSHVTMELKAMEDCLGQLRADVVFPGAGRATERLLRRVREDGAVVTVTYMPVTNHVISWESSPPPLRQQRPETAAVSADVAAEVSRKAAAVALRPEPGVPPAAQAPAGEAVTEMQPGPQTALGYICSVIHNDDRDYLRLTLESQEDCRGRRTAEVVFPGDGNSGFWSKLASTKRELTAFRDASFVVSVTYVREPDGIPGYPELWDRVIEWSAAPPPVRQERP
jgi:hypothetical protein